MVRQQVKSEVCSDGGGSRKKEREELKTRIERLTESVKSVKVTAHIAEEAKATPRIPKITGNGCSEEQTATTSRGPGITSARPFIMAGGRYNATNAGGGGWGHVQRECATQENLNLEGATEGQPFSRRDSRPGVSTIKSCIKNDSTILKQTDLYLNPNPLIQLIAKANETEVNIENQRFTALIDSGAPISQITKSLITALGLEMKHLNDLLLLDGTGGIDVPSMDM